MQVLEQNFILLSTLFLLFAIILNQNKIHKSRKCNLHLGGKGGLNLASLKHAFLPWAQDKSIN